MLKPNHSNKDLSLKRNRSGLKSATSIKRKFKIGATHVPSMKDIPNIISQVQKSLSLLRKIYFEETKAENNEQRNRPRKLIRPHTVSLIRPQKISQQEYFQQEETTALSNELDELKKSFLNCNGFESNNIVELYNFYRKNAEKSTRLFGSTSMSNMVNLTQNQSEIKERTNKANSYIIASQQNPKETQNQTKNTQIVVEEELRLPIIKNDPLTKKASEMVRVAHLLAEKKKISRTAICENMNSENLINQAKKKLQRLNPCENLERFSKLKENIKNQNIKNSPLKDKKQQHSETKRVRSIHSSKKNSAKKISEKDFEKQIQEFNCFQQNPNLHSTERLRQRSQKIMETEQKQKYLIQIKQNKEGVSAKSSRSFKSVKSPNSIKSPCLNRGGFLDMTGSCEKSSKKNSAQYFIPKVHANNHDSLLDCEITAKEQSRNLDLESIPFDF